MKRLTDVAGSRADASDDNGVSERLVHLRALPITTRLYVCWRAPGWWEWCWRATGWWWCWRATG